MAWTPKSEGDWMVYTETVTLTATATDQSTSVIDFAPYGQDWWVETVYANTLATTAGLDVDMAFNENDTFTVLKADLDALATDVLTNLVKYDNSANGNAPYYKLRLDKAGALSSTASSAATANTVTFRVAVPPKNGVVY